MAQEAAYLRALETATSYEITNQSLTISNSEGKIVLAFAKISPPPLAGTGWTLTAYNSPNRGFLNVLTGSVITLEFEDDGKLTGSTGCNSFTASYQVDGEKIQIRSLVSTRNNCNAPGGLMEQEEAYLRSLQEATRYAVEGEMLHLYDLHGNHLAEFRANR